jgi:hypothetical protein
MYKFFINFCFLFVFVFGFSQEKKSILNKKSEKDSIIYTSPYGLRVGLDLSKPVFSLLENGYTGFEIVADYRLSKRFFIASEIGSEEETVVEDYTNSTAKGNYLKLGFNFNAYNNWLDMNNEIFLGMRYGFSLFDHVRNSYTPNIGDFYFPNQQINIPLKTTNLTAHWTEFVVGLKAETFKNIFVGFSLSYKIIMRIDDPENFKTLYVPGFNRVYQSDTGFGFNYSISYTIPFVNK